MLLGGDEFARTQRGNNNAYCQDNDITWYKWEFDDEQKRLLDFTTRLIALSQGASEPAPSQILPGPEDSRLGRA